MKKKFLERQVFSISIYLTFLYLLNNLFFLFKKKIFFLYVLIIYYSLLNKVIYPFISFLNLFFISLAELKTYLYLITYLFLFLTYLFFNWIKEHPVTTFIQRTQMLITYSMLQSRTTYDDCKNKPSLYP